MKNIDKYFKKVDTINEVLNVYQPTENTETWYIFIKEDFPFFIVPRKVFLGRDDNIMKFADHCNSDKITCSESLIGSSDINPHEYLLFKKDDVLEHFNSYLEQISIANGLNFYNFLTKNNSNGILRMLDLSEAISFIKFLESKKLIDKKTLDDIIVFNDLPDDPLLEIKDRVLKFFTTNFYIKK